MYTLLDLIHDPFTFHFFHSSSDTNALLFPIVVVPFAFTTFIMDNILYKKGESGVICIIYYPPAFCHFYLMNDSKDKKWSYLHSIPLSENSANRTFVYCFEFL